MSVAFSPSGKTRAVACQDTVGLRDSHLGGPSRHAAGARLAGKVPGVLARWWQTRGRIGRQNGASVGRAHRAKPREARAARRGHHFVGILTRWFAPGLLLAGPHVAPVAAVSRRVAAGCRDTPCLPLPRCGVFARWIEGRVGWGRPVEWWDVGSERKLTVVDGQNWRIASVAFSPDGTTLATGFWNHTMRPWDMRGYEGVATLDGHAHFVHSVAFSPDGVRIASGSHDMTVRLWDVVTRKETFILQGHSDAVWSVAFSPDHKRLASGSIDRTVRL